MIIRITAYQIGNPKNRRTRRQQCRGVNLKANRTSTTFDSKPLTLLLIQKSMNITGMGMASHVGWISKALRSYYDIVATLLYHTNACEALKATLVGMREIQRIARKLGRT